MIYKFKMKIKFIIIWMLFMCFNKVYSQHILTKIIKEKAYFYNGVLYENRILFGSSQGLVEYVDGNIYNLDTELKGPIKIKNEKIIVDDSNRFFEKSKDYIKLLPDNLKSSSITSLITERFLFLVSKGVIYQFEYQNATIKSFPSVRTISKNYVGTYGGIFNLKNEKLTYPDYTDGKIKEYGELTFICWHGLYILKNNEGFVNYLDPDYSGVRISNKNLGSARDIEQINSDEYILFTNIGVYRINIKNNTSETILENGASAGISFIEQNDVLGLISIYFHSDKSLYKYNVQNKDLKDIYTSENKIISSIGVTNNDFYILSNGLKLFSIINSQITQIKKDIYLSNDIVLFNNQILITKNSGLDVYNIITDKYLENIITDEFNRSANFIDNNLLYLGSTSGVYELNAENLSKLYFEKLKQQNNIKNKKIEYTKLEIILLLLLAVLIVYILFLTQKFILARNQSNEIKSNDIYPEIESFVENNLSKVSIKMICREFNINTLELYKLNEKIKPGELIRLKRIKKVRELRNKKISEHEISKQTGFSLSYLKKI